MVERYADREGNGVYGHDESYTLVYLYDENGAPIGMRYREPNMAANTFQNFFFEKNLQGDVIGIWNQSGTKVITYTYDAWGRVIVSVRDITTDKEGLLALAEACNRLSLSPIHLYDVIEDYLVEN